MKTMMASFQTSPYSLAPDEGRRILLHGAGVVIKATSEQTGGTFNLFEMTCPAGFATTLDIHYAEDIAVFVLEGTLTFFWGSRKKEAKKGAYFFQPRGTPHGFRVENESSARILVLTIPAGMDRMVMEKGQPVPDPEKMSTAARYKVEILGPLPE